ncbi:proton-conducting transporter transmembrane domain-containing protein [Campylobacter sp. JMF_08 NE1]|uniref:proton-conducting transporter transmembrane domain-containing protein n=1 Tax=Campylobacter sp. JMF_08 NE1 TaxID=2983821 RepID=UPI0022E9FCA0|nr:proton-conducting transporter membrane subunit [Campylobacter sp. JMF_08 NE1]MDA3047478.1 proton-conducting transporter membrane subunit [Campylobacter sp. JMF_08 NE1]
MLEFIFISYLLIGVISLALYNSQKTALYFGFISNAAISVVGALYFLSQLHGSSEFVLRGFLFEPSFLLTPLGAFFSFIVCFIGAMSAIYSLGYLQNFKLNFAVKSALFSFFMLSMLMVISSNDVFGFVVLWELMTLVSALMLKFNDTPSSNFTVMLYLGVAQVGAFCIVIAFLIMAHSAGSLHFSDWNFNTSSLFICILLFIGFGTKAGLAPFHVWSPLAYPLANSNVSALFSSAMSKVAIFGLIKFMLIAKIPASFALAMMILGAFGAVWGIIFAALQNEYKKLIAYSSVENMGIILLALGAGLYGLATANNILAAFGLAGAILHSLNHSVFKAVLFFAAGNIYNASKKLKINYLGGLAKFMPITAFCSLIAVLSIVAIPLFNGFASEWLIYKALLSKTDPGISRLVFALSTIGLTLAGVLCAFAFVKFYGLIFSGKAKGEYREASIFSLVPMVILALFCVILALSSPMFVSKIWSFMPVSDSGATLSFSLLWLCLIAMLILPFAILLAFKSPFEKPKLSDPWANGFKFQSEFLPNSNTAVGDLRRVLAKFMCIKMRKKGSSYSIIVKDVFMEYIYKPIIDINMKIADKIAIMQNGKSATYAFYMVLYLGILGVGIFYFFGGKL